MEFLLELLLITGVAVKILIAMENKGLGFWMEKFCLKWQKSEPDTTVIAGKG